MSSPPLDILYLGALPPDPQSLAIVGAQLVAGLVARGHRIRAVSRVRCSSPGWDDSASTLPPEVRVTRLAVAPSSTPLAQAREHDWREVNTRIRAAADAEIAAGRPDVLLANGTSLGGVLSALATAHGLPGVLILHGGTVSAILDGALPPARTRALVGGLRGVDQLVTVAPHVAESLAPLGLSGIRVIGNPVDLGRFAPGPKSPGLLARWDVSPEDIVVAHASTLTPRKRPLDIVRSAEGALRANPRLLYLVVGDGPLRADMERLCARRAVAARFRFVGWVDHAGVPGHFRVADVVVMPSEDEAQSLVYLEAQACGRLLLASDIAAARSVIADGDTGLLFRKGDVAHLAARTLEAAADPGLRARIGGRARVAVQAYGVELIVTAYEEVLRETVARRPRRSP
jgi:glycosyltransferase involved in cell wall biosynthesis